MKVTACGGYLADVAFIIEQAFKQKRKESLRRLLELVRYMQNQDRRRTEVLPALRLQGKR